MGNEYREVEAQTVERHRCGLFLQTEFRGLSACVSGCFTIVSPETTSEPIVIMFRAFHKEPCVRWDTNPPKIKGTGIFKRDMLGHARRCPTTDILKVTHKGQHAAMRPARHHHCGHLLSFVNLILKWSVRPPEGLFSFLFREPFALDFRLSDIGGTNSI